MSTVALDDIWDVPVEPSTPGRHTIFNGDEENVRGSSKKLLFLDSDSEEEEPQPRKGTKHATTPARPDIDAMFDNLDNDEDVFQQLAPSLDMEALQREAEQRHAQSSQSNLHAILPSSSPNKDRDPSMTTTSNRYSNSSKDVPKERKVLPKLDEARLLGPDGFPVLITEAKKFKPRGKGQEATDLTRVIQLYRFWTHKMYPKMQFRDTVQRVEKLCHSKRMNVALSVWRDEAKGLINGMKPEDPIDLASDSEDDDADNDEKTEKRSSRLRDIAGGRNASNPPSAGARRPSSSPFVGPVTDVDDFDIDVMIREQEKMEAERALVPQKDRPAIAVMTQGSHSKAAMDTDDDEAMWDAMMTDDIIDVPAAVQGTTTSGGAVSSGQNTEVTPGQQNNVDTMDDEDMWDVVREMEMESQAPSEPGRSCDDVESQPAEYAAISSPQKKRRISNADDWDDMYA